MAKPKRKTLTEFIGFPVEPALKRRLRRLTGNERGEMTRRARKYIREGVERDEQAATAPPELQPA